MIRWLFLAVVLAAAGWGVWRYGPSLSRKVSANAPNLIEVPTTLVKRGNVEFTIEAKGELQGGNNQMLTVPMTGGQAVAITFLAPNGDLLKADDVVVQFDTTEQDFRLREANADLAEAEQQIIQAQAEADAKEEETRYLLLQAESEVRLAENEMRRNEVLPRLV